MANADTVRSQIQTPEGRLARLRVRRQHLVAQAARADRRRDTRRKIVLGGTVLAAVAHEGVPALRDASELGRWLDRQLQRPADRAVFGLEVLPNDP